MPKPQGRKGGKKRIDGHDINMGDLMRMRKTPQRGLRVTKRELPQMIVDIYNAYPEIENEKITIAKYEKNELKLYALVSGILQYESIESDVLPLNAELIKMINKIIFILSDRMLIHNWNNRASTQYPFIGESEKFLDKTNEITTKYKSSFNRTLGLCMIVLEHISEMETKYDKIKRASKPLEMMADYYNRAGITLYDELEDAEDIWNKIEKLL
jgi:hypothetical protein